MPMYKNISGGSLALVVPGFEAHVGDGETVDIPAFQPDGTSPIVVPLNRWEPVSEPVVAAEKPKSAPSSEDNG